eukprot:7738080-Pyramimonas_sp.AAC.1
MAGLRGLQFLEWPSCAIVPIKRGWALEFSFGFEVPRAQGCDAFQLLGKRAPCSATFRSARRGVSL